MTTTPTTPHDPAHAAQAVREAAERLLAALGQETAALVSRQPAQFQRAVSDKLAAVAGYEQAVRALDKLNASWQAHAGEAAVLRLRDLGERIEAAADENRKRLEVARAAQKHLVDHIVEAVSGADEGPGTYGAAGAVRKAARGSAPPPPVSFCRAL
jgi:hypothetical protein